MAYQGEPDIEHQEAVFVGAWPDRMTESKEGA
jgi:hypothetical protein